MERLKVTHQTAGLLSALAAAVNVIGNLTAGLLLSRAFSRPALLIVAFLVMGLASFGIFLPYLPDSAAFGLCLLFSTVGGVIPAILLSSASIVAPSAGLAPIVLGLIIQGNNLGQILVRQLLAVYWNGLAGIQRPTSWLARHSLRYSWWPCLSGAWVQRRSPLGWESADEHRRSDAVNELQLSTSFPTGLRKRSDHNSRPYAA